MRGLKLVILLALFRAGLYMKVLSSAYPCPMLFVTAGVKVHGQ